MLTAESFADLGERGPLWVWKPEVSGNVRAEDSALRDQVLTLE